MAVAAPRSAIHRVSHAMRLTIYVRRFSGYVVALAFPWAAMSVTLLYPAFRMTPLALNLAVIAAIGTFFDLGPTLIALLATLALFDYHSLIQHHSWDLGGTDLSRSALIFAVGALLAWLTQSRKRAAARLRITLASLEEQDAALRQAQQGSNSAAWMHDTASGTTSWYPGGMEVFGSPFEALAAVRSPLDLVSSMDRRRVSVAAQRAMRSGQPFEVEYRVQWPNGSLHWLESRGIPTAPGSTVWRGITMDVTARKETELALLRSEKLAAAGRLAASMAHEINNPLASVTNLVYLAKGKAADEETRGWLTSAESELRRLAEIAGQTLRFHRQQSAPAMIEVGHLFESVLALYGPRLSHAAIRVRFDRKEGCSLVCREGELRQLFSIVVRNALDAMPHGGMLRVRVRPSTDWRGGGKALRVAIADSGHGMPPETRRRIYEPFFTTRADVGTGLSLWVAAGIVERQGGRLHVRSSVGGSGRGTTFSLVLPSLVLPSLVSPHSVLTSPVPPR